MDGCFDRHVLRCLSQACCAVTDMLRPALGAPQYAAAPPVLLTCLSRCRRFWKWVLIFATVQFLLIQLPNLNYVSGVDARGCAAAPCLALGCLACRCTQGMACSPA